MVFFLLKSICGFYTFTFLKFYRVLREFSTRVPQNILFFSNLLQQSNGAVQIFAGAPWGSAGASRRPSSGPASGRSSALAAALLPDERSNRCICKKSSTASMTRQLFWLGIQQEVCWCKFLGTKWTLLKKKKWSYFIKLYINILKSQSDPQTSTYILLHTRL